MQLFLDLDGVLADFDGYYFECFGIRLDRNSPEDPPNMWHNIRSHGSFYRDMPLMKDAELLWQSTAHLKPVILTGVSYFQVPDAERQKRAWLKEHLSDAEIICCKSRDKRKHGKPGDCLIDDWARYRHLWEEMGGDVHFAYVG